MGGVGGGGGGWALLTLFKKSYIAVLIIIVFELTRFVKLQSVVKIKFILIQARGKLITGLIIF